MTPEARRKLIHHLRNCAPNRSREGIEPYLTFEDRDYLIALARADVNGELTTGEKT